MARRADPVSASDGSAGKVLRASVIGLALAAREGSLWDAAGIALFLRAGRATR